MMFKNNFSLCENKLSQTTFILGKVNSAQFQQMVNVKKRVKQRYDKTAETSYKTNEKES